MSTALVPAAPAALDRRTFLGGSDIAAILGISPWKTAYQLWLEKTSDEPAVEDPRRSAVLRRGKRLEPLIIEWAREELDLNIVSRNQRYIDPVYPFFQCEIDFEHEYNGAIENADAKSARKAYEWGEPGTDAIPDYYTAQFLWGQMITGRESTLCMAMFSLDKMQPYRVMRDKDLISAIRSIALDFWRMVESRTPPEMSKVEDANLAWKRARAGKQAVATKEIAEIARRYKLMQTALRGDEAKAELFELDLKKHMQDAEELVDEEGRLIATWKNQARKSYTVAASEFRVLRVTGRD